MNFALPPAMFFTTNSLFQIRGVSACSSAVGVDRLEVEEPMRLRPEERDDVTSITIRLSCKFRGQPQSSPTPQSSSISFSLFWIR